MEALFETKHSIRLSGVGAAHQNGIDLFGSTTNGIRIYSMAIQQDSQEGFNIQSHRNNHTWGCPAYVLEA
eukprot:4399120-Ditylum_brightwellii.AAC.1